MTHKTNCFSCNYPIEINLFSDKTLNDYRYDNSNCPSCGEPLYVSSDEVEGILIQKREE